MKSKTKKMLNLLAFSSLGTQFHSKLVVILDLNIWLCQVYTCLSLAAVGIKLRKTYKTDETQNMH